MSDEKTEKPTPKRRKENRKEGQVARTQELGAWSALLMATLLMPRLIAHEIESMSALMVTSLRSMQEPSIGVAMQLLRDGAIEILLALVTLGACVLVVSVAATVAQGGFYLATKAVKPKLSKLDPIKGAKRVFGPQSLWEGAKMLLKCAVVAGFVYSSVKAMMPSPSGSSVGMSLAECTATSMRPSSSAVSSSLTNRPLSPSLASGASRSLSPLVWMTSISTCR